MGLRTYPLEDRLVWGDGTRDLSTNELHSVLSSMTTKGSKDKGVEEDVEK